MSFPKVEIRPRRSMAFFAFLSIFMVALSYAFVILLAAACVYLPYLVLEAGSVNFQIVVLFLFGIVIAGAMLWSMIPRRDNFKAHRHCWRDALVDDSAARQLQSAGLADRARDLASAVC